jgi:hypothetical protein
VQRHQYPPNNAFHRDSYPPPAAPVGMTGPPVATPYMQGPHVPQTPPLATPSTGHVYLHRAQSVQSTPTPTSAHSQVHYGAPFVQGSPVAIARTLQQTDPHQRQSSQPPTPGAAPVSARPAQAQPVGYGHPPSPYQQRMPGPSRQPTLQTSPPPPPPPSLPRPPSTHSTHESHSQESVRAPQPPSERDQSLSVSPKTRVPSLPSSTGRPGTSVSELEPYPNNQTHSATTMRERAATPGKRKLDDRELRPEELERREVRPPPFDHPNGRAVIPAKAEAAHPHASQPRTFSAPRKKRKLYTVPPVWAQKLQHGQRPTHANLSLYKPTPGHSSQINGKADSLPSRHPSPEDSRRAMPAPQHSSAAQPAPAPMSGPDPSQEASLLGPWEPSITNEIPLTDTSRAIADFLFRFVIGNEDFNQIQSRGVHFEIEAKLGTLIDKHDNQPLRFPILTECILSEDGDWINRLGFRSNMSEVSSTCFHPVTEY